MLKYKKTIRGAANSESSFAVAEVIRERIIDRRTMSEMIHEGMDTPVIRSIGVLDAFSYLATQALLQGDTVKIDEFGTFKPSVTFENGKPVLSRIVFTPCKELKEAMANVDLVETE